MGPVSGNGFNTRAYATRLGGSGGGGTGGAGGVAGAASTLTNTVAGKTNGGTVQLIDANGLLSATGLASSPGQGRRALRSPVASAR